MSNTNSPSRTPFADDSSVHAEPGSLKRKRAATASRGVASLTPEQLEKKRANDREAQRAIRERTKNQIETLERRIEELTSQRPYQELQAALRQKEAVQQENDEIKRRLASVLAIISPILRAGGLSDLGVAPPRAHEFLSQNQSQIQYQAFNAEVSRPSIVSPPDTASVGATSSPNVQNTRSHVEARPGAPPTSHVRVWSSAEPPDHLRSRRAHGLDFLLDNTQEVVRSNHGSEGVSSPHGERQASFAAGNGYSPDLRQSSPYQCSPATAPPHLQLPRTLPPTCPLDGIFIDFMSERQQQAANGVSMEALIGPAYPDLSSLLTPGKAAYAHPMSKVFTDILGTFPNISTLPEQIATVYLMFLLMRWHVAPTEDNFYRLPDWQRPTPSQINIPHPLWIDYLPWPRMRDRMISDHPSYAFETWFIPFTTTLSVNWPYEPTDALLSASDSAADVQINPVFERHIRNLANWSIGPAFAKAYPHLVEFVRMRDMDEVGVGAVRDQP